MKNFGCFASKGEASLIFKFDFLAFNLDRVAVFGFFNQIFDN